MRHIMVKKSLIESAEEEIRLAANELKVAHTVDGVFPPGHKDTEEYYKYMIDLADRLKKALNGDE